MPRAHPRHPGPGEKYCPSCNGDGDIIRDRSGFGWPEICRDCDGLGIVGFWDEEEAA